MLVNIEFKPIQMNLNITKKEFIVKDNVGFGEWEWDMLANEWNVQDLEDWGVTLPTIKNTELLSNLEYDPLYYKPDKEPYIVLKDCVNFKTSFCSSVRLYSSKGTTTPDHVIVKKNDSLLSNFTTCSRHNQNAAVCTTT